MNQKGLIKIIPINKKQKYTVNIDALSSDGNGIAHIDGYTIFIPGAIPGDKAEIIPIKLNSGYARAELLKILSPSEHRVRPICPHFSKCGGCALMMCDYPYQLEFKKGVVHDVLLRIGGIDIDPTITGMSTPERYRNKMIFPFDSQGRWGFYRERSHEVVPLYDCLLGDKINSEICNIVSEYIKAYNIPVYNESTHTGIMRRVFIRCANNKIMVVISANCKTLPHFEQLVTALRRACSNITGIILNINTKKTNLVLGDKNITLWGKDTLDAHLLGLEYKISPHSFFQINPIQTEALYNYAIALAELSPKDVLMDIYCGIGTISLTAAKHCKSVIGVEIVPSAIANAEENAERNNITNAKFYCASASDIVPQLISEGLSPNVVILDPPRKGSDEKTLSAIVSAKPERIVYVSCNPATLARDARFLTENGYKAETAKAVDMFPHTIHVECCLLLRREEK